LPGVMVNDRVNPMTRLHMKKSPRFCFLFPLLLLLTASRLPAADWPQWRGPQRDGHCAETGLLAEWPKDGPKLLWQATNIHSGFSTPSVVGDRIYLLSKRGPRQTNSCSRSRAGMAAVSGRRNSARSAIPSRTKSSCRAFDANGGREIPFRAWLGRRTWRVSKPRTARSVGANISAPISAANMANGLTRNLHSLTARRSFATPGGSNATMVAFEQKNRRRDLEVRHARGRRCQVTLASSPRNLRA